MNEAAPGASDIISRVRITEVYIALGGPRLRSRRGLAFWRNGDGYNVALDDQRNTFYDFARGEGGGVLDLIQLVRGSTRKDALQWLADFAGIPINHRPLTKREWCESEHRRAVAELEARRMLAWKREILETLRSARNQYFRAYHRAKRYLIEHGADGGERLTLAFDVVELCEERFLDFDRHIDRIQAAEACILLNIFRPSALGQGSLTRVRRQDVALQRAFLKALSKQVSNQEAS